VISDYHVEKEYCVFATHHTIQSIPEDTVDIHVGSSFGYLWGGVVPTWHKGVVTEMLPSKDVSVVRVKAKFEDGVFTLSLDMQMYLSTPHKVGFSWVLLDSSTCTTGATLDVEVRSSKLEDEKSPNWGDSASMLDGSFCMESVNMEEKHNDRTCTKKRKDRSSYIHVNENVFDGNTKLSAFVRTTRACGPSILPKRVCASERTVLLHDATGDLDTVGDNAVDATDTVHPFYSRPRGRCPIKHYVCPFWDSR
jgi:hypothetical protein